MLHHILKRITKHKEFVSKFNGGEVGHSEFESFLLDEIQFLEQDFEEKINNEILVEEQKLLENIKKIQEIVSSNNIDKETLKNIVYSEFNHIFLKNHVL